MMSSPCHEPVSIDDWNKAEWAAEILTAKLRYLAIKEEFRKNPPELLTLEEIRQKYKATLTNTSE